MTKTLQTRLKFALLLRTGLRRFSLLLTFLLTLFGVLAAVTPVSAQLTDYVDPSGYPATTWPSTWSSYTRLGATQSDLTSGNSDASDGGTNPTQSADYSSGPSSSDPTLQYSVSGGILFFRLRIDGPPLGTGASEPYSSESWSIFFDTDGDGFKEWVLQLDGNDGVSIEPDDIVVAYNNDASQAWVSGDETWRQDSGDTTSADGPAVSGNPNGVATWDQDANAYRWDFGRTRIVQIDTSLSAGNNNSEYFIDVQVPLAAFDNGTQTLEGNFFTLSASTGNSNTNPTQKDVLSGGDNVTVGSTDEIPGGDVLDDGGTIYQPPVITSITDTLICPIDTIYVSVLDVNEVSGGNVVDTIDEVKLQYFLDFNANGLADDAGFSWTDIGNATRVSGVIGQWKYEWNMSQLANKQFLIRAVVTDDQGNITTSTDQAANKNAVVFNTCSSVPAYDASTKTLQDPPNPINPGASLNYVLRIRNNGGGADTNVVVADTLDTRFTFVQFLGTAGTVDSTSIPGTYIVTYNFATIAINQTFTRRFKVLLENVAMADSTVIANKAYVNSTKAAPFCAEVSFMVESLPSISLVKSVDNTTAAPGDTLLYTIFYDNVGTDNATLLVITDGSPDNTTYVSESVTVDAVAKTDAADADIVTVAFNGSGHDITISVGTVLPGGSGTITFKTIVN